jgi:(p)ppGpp synthase/HD superfamily hydrolase
MSTLERAIALAAEAHAGQFDKVGQPYILHPLRVMLAVSSLEERMAAILHDVVEDTAWTLDGLRGEGFPPAVIEAVGLLTKSDGDVYEEYVARIRANEMARRVKLADLADNSDLSRLSTVTEKDRLRLEKYAKARAMLEA